jgi:dTDP-4-dehydrorhamnose reductase
MVRALQGFGDCVCAGRDRADFDVAGGARAAVLDVNPDWVVNCAAYTQVDRSEDDVDRARRANTDAVGEIAEACAALGSRLVHYSTDYVFDGRSNIPYRESDPTAPLGIYGASKLAGEAIVRASGCGHLILRTSWVYAARGTNFLQRMLRLARERTELRVVDDQVGAPTWARFIAQATASMMWRCRTNEDAAAKVASGATVNVANSGSTSWYGFACALLDEAHATVGWPRPEVIPIASAEYPTRARRPQSSRLDLSVLREQWDIEPPDWRLSMMLCLQERLAAGA